MLYEDLKVICKVTLLNKMLFIVDLEVGKMFYTSTMLEFDHNPFLVYFSIIFLAKAIKSVNLLVCFSFIQGQSDVGQSDCRISNYSLE